MRATDLVSQEDNSHKAAKSDFDLNVIFMNHLHQEQVTRPIFSIVHLLFLLRINDLFFSSLSASFKAIICNQLK